MIKRYLIENSKIMDHHNQGDINELYIYIYNYYIGIYTYIRSRYILDTQQLTLGPMTLKIGQNYKYRFTLSCIIIYNRDR